MCIDLDLDIDRDYQKFSFLERCGAFWRSRTETLSTLSRQGRSKKPLLSSPGPPARIKLQGLLADLGALIRQGYGVGLGGAPGGRGLRVSGPLEQLRFPLHDLVRMNVKALRLLGQLCIALHSGERHLGLEPGTAIMAASLPCGSPRA